LPETPHLGRIFLLPPSAYYKPRNGKVKLWKDN